MTEFSTVYRFFTVLFPALISLKNRHYSLLVKNYPVKNFLQQKVTKLFANKSFTIKFFIDKVIKETINKIEL